MKQDQPCLQVPASRVRRRRPCSHCCRLSQKTQTYFGNQCGTVGLPIPLPPQHQRGESPIEEPEARSSTSVFWVDLDGTASLRVNLCSPPLWDPYQLTGGVRSMLRRTGQAWRSRRCLFRHIHVSIRLVTLPPPPCSTYLLCWFVTNKTRRLRTTYLHCRRWWLRGPL